MKFIVLTCFIFQQLVNQVTAKECGLQRVSPSQLIVGGGLANPGEFPWFVEMRYKENRTSDWSQGCGGALIRDNWVLTAGHCAMAAAKDDPQLYTAFVDVTDLDSNDLWKHQVKVTKIIMHEQYNLSYEGTADHPKSFRVVNDIGLYKIDTSTLVNATSLMPICLYDPNVTMMNECWSAGFGQTSSKSSLSSKLKKLDNWVTVDRNCVNPNIGYDKEKQLCVGGRPRAGQGMCAGDSGSAFLCKGTDNQFYELGVLSHGTSISLECAAANHPDVYTRVSYYIDWIENTIRDN